MDTSARPGLEQLDLEGPTRDYLEVLFEKAPATQKFNDWSINRGHVMSKTTFLEWLDLLRQDFSVENAKRFVSVVLEQMPYHPKELLYIVEWLTRHRQSDFEQLRASLRQELGGLLNHSPPSPQQRDPS
jgi:hypothetical protein